MINVIDNEIINIISLIMSIYFEQLSYILIIFWMMKTQRTNINKQIAPITLKMDEIIEENDFPVNKDNIRIPSNDGIIT